MQNLRLIIKQLKNWQERLLNLNVSNPLLCIDRARISKLLVKAPEMNSLFDILVGKGRELKLPFVVRDLNGDGYLLKDEGEIQFDAEIEELEKRFRRLHMLSRVSIEEKGVVSLFMTFGVLKFTDPEFPVPYLLCPMLLTPCEMHKKVPNSAFKIGAIEGETQLNPILELLLREKYKIDLPEIDPVDLKKSVQLIETALIGHFDWLVLSQCWFLTLNPETVVLYNDLQNILQNEKIMQHPILRSLAGARIPHEQPAVMQPSVPLIPVLEADSSQLTILNRVRNGENIVVHGPPGTGKSQTIVNIIADALLRGKSVLFVSAKRAALDIVYDRLKNIGLERFCLEIHSTKKSKMDLILDLKNAIESLQLEQTVERPDQLFRQFLAMKKHLNDFVRVLHRNDHPLGISVYEAILKLEGMKDCPAVTNPLTFSRVAGVSAERLEKYLQILEDFEELCDVYTNADQHPWKGFELKADLIPQPSKVIEFITHTKVFLEDVNQSLIKIGFLNVGELNFDVLQKMVKPLESLAHLKVLSAKWFRMNQERFSEVLQVLRSHIKEIEEMQSLFRAYAAHTSKPAEELAEILSPAEGVYKKWTRILRPSYWKWIRYVNTKLNYPHSFVELANLYLLVKNVLEHKKKIDEQRDILSTCISEQINEVEKAKLVLREMKTTSEIAEIFKSPQKFIQSDLMITRETQELIFKLLEYLQKRVLEKLMNYLDIFWKNGFVDSRPTREVSLNELLQKIQNLLENQDKLYEWIRLQEILQNLQKFGLLRLVRRVEIDNKNNLRNLREIFEKSFYRQWIDYVCSETNVDLRSFSKQDIERVIDGLEKTEEKLRQQWIGYIRSTVSLRIKRILQSTSNDIVQQLRIVLRETQKKRRHKPIRKLFYEAPDVLRSLKPCVFMSPISAASFLDLAKYAFCYDLVIFDEASQLMSPEAVSAIVRGKQVIVAGDPNQLPPTTFFKSFFESEDAENDFEPLDSFLDECIAAPQVFKEGYLRWHYRSRDERLIAFSNYYFYSRNSLMTFPSPNQDDSSQGVRLVYVENGIWDRARSRTNLMEARKVVELVIEHFRKYPRRTLGVVTMNIAQRNLIEDLLYDVIEEDPDLADSIFAPSNEPFFIKSLENVQGDERDTIIISIGYGRSKDGSLSYSFGPLNHEAGWRRLNVLVTRARYQIVLVTSLKSSDLLGVNPDNRGALALKNYIEYAEQKCKLKKDDFEKKEFDILPKIIASELEKRGILVDTNIGLGLCHVSLGIKDSKDSSRYIVGFVHDGKNHSIIEDAFDREVLKFKVLQRLGWSLRRIWTVEWYVNPTKVVENILQAVNERSKSVI